jgi:hypothetical protein
VRQFFVRVTAGVRGTARLQRTASKRPSSVQLVFPEACTGGSGTRMAMRLTVAALMLTGASAQDMTPDHTKTLTTGNFNE